MLRADAMCHSQYRATCDEGGRFDWKMDANCSQTVGYRSDLLFSGTMFSAPLLYVMYTA